MYTHTHTQGNAQTEKKTLKLRTQVNFYADFYFFKNKFHHNSLLNDMWNIIYK